MTIATGLVLLVTVVVIVLLLTLVLRPRRRRLVNKGRRRRGGYRRRRMDAIKRAAAADIALIRGDERLPPLKDRLAGSWPAPSAPRMRIEGAYCAHTYALPSMHIR
jgi:hypothetical protein